ncbi:MAG: rhomboid family intramembrane serine protease [Candidatus Nanohaloarchaea archaeon]
MTSLKTGRYKPRLVYFLIFLNLVVFAAQIALPLETVKQYAFSMENLLQNPVSVLSYGFMHAGPGHIAGNMVALFLQGRILERSTGKGKLALTYAAGTIAGGLVWLPLNPEASLVGASAATSAILGANVLASPDRSLLEEVPLLRRIPLPGIRNFFSVAVWAALMLIFNIQATVKGAGDVATIAHLGGFAAGAMLIWTTGETDSRKGAVLTPVFALLMAGIALSAAGSTVYWALLLLFVVLALSVRRL